MSESRRYHDVSARLDEERARLESVRADYEAIVRSRFHALRMLWFSLKQLLGLASPNDVYAVWSPGAAPPLRRRIVAGAPVVAELPDTVEGLREAWNGRVSTRAMSETPTVSVVIPAFNHLDLTLQCLRSIAETWFESLDVQFIIVDDASTDATSGAIAGLDGIELLRLGRNEGFVRACNRGAMLARGKYLCFLNNDTVVQGGWLDLLTSTAESDQTIGVVGAKLVYPDGRLQEAGSIVWRDATGWNVGRYESPHAPAFNFVRDVDYVSGAALLVRRDLFEQLGGFSELYRPAYYEDADLCFGARALGYRVVYQPLSVVTHHDGASAGDEKTGVKRFQEINRKAFREKWAAQLEEHLENNHFNVASASRAGKRGRGVLVVDSYVPLHDREAGSQRMFNIVRMLREIGYEVTFLPDNYAPMQPYTRDLQQMGVEVLYHVDGGPPQREALEAVLPRLDFAWICRPDLYEKYEPFLRRSRSIRLIYDTVDLHHVRKRREAEVLGQDTEWREWLKLETESAKRADVTVVVTPDERRVLAELGVSTVCVVPTIHEPVLTGRNFEESSGLLFIGNYNHSPNVDAVQWLCDAVMPIVWQKEPAVHLTLVGANPTQAVHALKSDRVRVTGYVRDVSMYFRDSRLFVAPLRYGAGLKGKIGHALAYSLPVVTTPTGAEGFGFLHGANALIAPPDAEAFAAAILAAYSDEDLWSRLSIASHATLQPFSAQAVMPRLHAVFEASSSLQPA